MRSTIPTVQEVKEALAALETPRLRWLAKRAGVPYTTLWKIRDGTTSNPGIDTVRKFAGFIKAARKV